MGAFGHLGIWVECKINKLRVINVMAQFKSPLPHQILLPLFIFSSDSEKQHHVE